MVIKNLIARSGVDIRKIHFISDDEPGLFLAFKDVFTDTTVHLCGFHFLNSCTKWLNANGYNSLINTKNKKFDDRFSPQWRVIKNLALLPRKLIIPIVKLLMADDITKTINLEPFYAYLLRKMTPQFIERLSWFDFIIENKYQYLDVTSNKIESSHHSLNTYLKEIFLHTLEYQSVIFYRTTIFRKI